MTNKNRITYAELFWLFMAGSLLGVIIEGVFCVFHYGHWETHTVAVWGPFCIIYGFGAVGLYIGAHHLRGKGLIAQFLVYALVCTVIEYLCGALLRYGLHMCAWDYTKSFLNFQGLICLNATLVWGAAGVIFSKWLAPPLRRLFMRIQTLRVAFITNIDSIICRAIIIRSKFALGRQKGLFDKRIIVLSVQYPACPA